MVRGKELTSEKRAQVVILYKENISIRQIAKKLGISHSTVVATVKRNQELKSFKSRSRAGRPKVTSNRMDNAIIKAAKKSPRASSSAIRGKLPGSPSKKPNSRTIRRRLFDAGLKSYRPARKPKLSPKNIRDRIAFCQKYRQWTPAQWKQVMFSDETTFTQFYSFCRHVRRPPNQRHNPKYVIPTVKQAPKVMVWGAVSGSGRAGIWIMPKNTTINGAVYLSILMDKLPPFVPIHGITHFQHDGAPCHGTKAVKDWLRSENIPLLEPWPGNSPDLNIIENVWTVMKQKIAAHSPSSEDDLINWIKRVWVQEITPDYCKKLCKSMPGRIENILKNKGFHCKY
jgi:transposase